MNVTPARLRRHFSDTGGTMDEARDFYEARELLDRLMGQLRQAWRTENDYRFQRVASLLPRAYARFQRRRSAWTRARLWPSD